MSRYTLLTALLILLVSCKSEVDNSGKTILSVSILPQQYFIERIAGDLIEVNVLIPPGASPATYEPTVTQLQKLSHSRLYLRIGYIGFEMSWIEKIESVNPGMKIVDLSEGITPIYEENDSHEHLHGHAHGGTDPHIWMSVPNAKIIVRNIYFALLELFPNEKELLEQNFNTLIREMDGLHKSIEDILVGKEGRSFMIYHPALSYFARDYNMFQHSLEIGGKTPSPAHMKWMIDLGRDENVRAIFIQNQFDQKNAEVLAREIGAEIVQINPLDPDWNKQMFYIAKQLNSSLSWKTP